MSEIDLLPRADLPVIWDAFKAQVEEFRETAETLLVTDVSQKDKMELACRTRLTLRKIRIAVEHKRVELGEGHLKEIQKVNGAAKAIREFIEPLEARLLEQEGFAERAEEKRIAELTRCRNAEIDSIRLGAGGSNTGQITQADYDVYIARLRAEKAEIETANRLRIEAEKRLAAAKAEALAVAVATRAANEKRDAEVRDELDRQRILAQQERDAAAWKAQQERIEAAARLAEERAKAKVEQDLANFVAAELRRVQDEQLAKERAVRDADLAEQKRIRDEQFAILEAELAQERAAKQAEADAARKLALAPDVEQLRAFSTHLKSILKPVLKSPEAEACLGEASFHFGACLLILDTFGRD